MESLQTELTVIAGLIENLRADAELAARWVERFRLGLGIYEEASIDLDQRVRRNLGELFDAIDAAKQHIRELPGDALDRLNAICPGWKDRVALSLHKTEGPFHWMRPSPEMDISQFYSDGFATSVQAISDHPRTLQELAELLAVFQYDEPKDVKPSIQLKGVSFQDAALIVNEGDSSLVAATVKRWCATREGKPRPIGKDPDHRQRNLFFARDVGRFLSEIEIGKWGSERQSQLVKLERPVRAGQTHCTDSKIANSKTDKSP